MNRINQQVRLGNIEIWEVGGEMMAHPFHIHASSTILSLSSAFNALATGGCRYASRDSPTRRHARRSDRWCCSIISAGNFRRP